MASSMCGVDPWQLWAFAKETTSLVGKPTGGSEKNTTEPLRGFAGGLGGAVCFPWPTKVHMAIGL